MEDKVIEILEPAKIADMTKEIIEAGADQGKASALLMQLTEAYTNLYATHADISTQHQKAQEEIAGLKQYNFDIMQKYGNYITGTSSGSKPEDKENKTRAETITIEDLFKKEGE